MPRAEFIQAIGGLNPGLRQDPRGAGFRPGDVCDGLARREKEIAESRHFGEMPEVEPQTANKKNAHT
eukprot:9184397-Pyramimonas_sp.AAC.1